MADFTCPNCGPYTPVVNLSHRCENNSHTTNATTLTYTVERVMSEHTVRGYFCSCGEEVNDSVRHVAANIARAVVGVL